MNSVGVRALSDSSSDRASAIAFKRATPRGVKRTCAWLGPALGARSSVVDWAAHPAELNFTIIELSSSGNIILPNVKDEPRLRPA